MLTLELNNNKKNFNLVGLVYDLLIEQDIRERVLKPVEKLVSFFGCLLSIPSRRPSVLASLFQCCQAGTAEE